MSKQRSNNLSYVIVLVMLLSTPFMAYGVSPADDIREKKFVHDFSKMLKKAKATGSMRIIVGVELDQFKGEKITRSNANEYNAHAAFKVKQLLNEHVLKDVKDVVLLEGSPYVAMTVTASELEALKNLQSVIYVQEDVASSPQTLKSLPSIGGSMDGSFV